MDGEQPSFTDAGYGNRRRVSRREQFPATMDATLPWARWVGLIEPHHYSDRPGKTGRTAKPVATMLRMYLLQVWLSLSGEGAGDAGLRLLRDAEVHAPGLRPRAGPG